MIVVLKARGLTESSCRNWCSQVWLSSFSSALVSEWASPQVSRVVRTRHEAEDKLLLPYGGRNTLLQ